MITKHYSDSHLSPQVGQLQLVDLQSADSPPLEIPAHDSALSIIQLNVQVRVILSISVMSIIS